MTGATEDSVRFILARFIRAGGTQGDVERAMEVLSKMEFSGHPDQLQPLRLDGAIHDHLYVLSPPNTPDTKALRSDPYQATGRSRGEKAWLKRKNRH